MTSPATANPMTAEPTITLPTRRLLVVPIVAALVAGGAWTMVSLIAGADRGVMLLGVWSAAIATVAMVAGTLLLMPWKARPITLWMTLWLAGTMVRFVVAAALAFPLYSATHAGEWMVVASVGGAYFTALLAEAVALAEFIRRESAA